MNLEFKNNFYAHQPSRDLADIKSRGSVTGGLVRGKITEEELDWVDRLEIQHRLSLPKFDLSWQIETFPEAKSIIKAKLLAEVAICEKDIAEADKLQTICDDIIYRKSPKKDEWFWNALVEVLYLNPLRIEQRKILKRDLMYLSMLTGNSSTKNPIGVTPIEIAKAKEFPVNELVEFKHNMALCPFHHEKTPSFYYRKKNNTTRCYGACDKRFDSIALYQALHNCSFIEAVRKLQ